MGKRAKFGFLDVHKDDKVITRCTYRECDEATVLGVNHTPPIRVEYDNGEIRDIQLSDIIRIKPISTMGNKWRGPKLHPKKPKSARVWRMEDGLPLTPRGKAVEWVYLIKELNRLERKIARLEGRL